MKFTGIKTRTEEELQARLPEATPAECRRYLKCFPKKNEAFQRLQAYLQWRQEMELDENTSTSSFSKNLSEGLSWEACMEKAVAYTGEGGESSRNKESEDEIVTTVTTSSLSSDDDSAPKNFGHPLFHELTDESNPTTGLATDLEWYPVFYHCPGRLDFSLGYTASTFAMAYALYADSRMDRKSEDQVTLLIDVRAGHGWPNPLAVTLISFIKQMMTAMANLVPGRVYRCIIFPVPLPLVVMFKALIKPFIGSTLHLTMLSGQPFCNSPVPSTIKAYLSEDTLVKMEQARRSVWKEDDEE